MFYFGPRTNYSVVHYKKNKIIKKTKNKTCPQIYCNVLFLFPHRIQKTTVPTTCHAAPRASVTQATPLMASPALTAKSQV